MKDGKHCPACGREIGFWTVFFAGLPSHIRCPHCRAQLAFADTGLVVACLVALGLVLAAGAYAFASRFYVITRIEFHLLAGGLALALLLAMNFAAAAYLRATKMLHLRSAKPEQ